MMSQSLTNFYNGWTQKANSMAGNTLSEVYDKYITSFIIFNSLYNQVSLELAKRGTMLPKKIYDNTAATEYIVKYLGAKTILTELTNENNDTDIDVLINIIDKKLFYIKLKYGQRQMEEDKEIHAGLCSKHVVEKAMAILQVVYHVRCNIFHGHKEFIEYQRILVEPLINILTTINKRLYSELSK